MSDPQIVQLTDDDFDDLMGGLTGPVLVDFWAAWCGPCKMIAPTLEKLAGEYAGRATVAKVNVDDNAHVAARFNIRSIPTLMVFKGGKVVDQVIGAVPEAQLRQLVDKHLDA